MKKQKLVVITSYPQKGKPDSRTGLAFHAKTALESFGKAKDVKITVLSEVLAEPNQYRNNGITVKRIWKRNSLTTFSDLLIEIWKHHKDTKHVLLEFDFTIFGSLPYLLPLPIFLSILRILGKKITIVFHIAEPQTILPNEGILTFRGIAYKLFTIIIYRISLLTASRAIVFEETLKEYLKNFGKTRKIIVIPNGVPKFENIPSKSQARKKLGIASSKFVVLFFGFLSWRVGADWIIEAARNMENYRKRGKDNIEFIVAGGAHPTHKDNEEYQKYIEKLENKCSEAGVLFTGTTQEKDIPYLFQAADIVVFPYRTLISSIPLSLAFSFKKPFLVSSNMLGVLKTQDIAQAMNMLKVTHERVSFFLNAHFFKQLNFIQKNSALRKKLTKLSREIALMRSWDATSKRYYETIFN